MRVQRTSLRIALKACYGWKPLRIVTKKGEFSLVLSGIPLAFFLLRIIWPCQFIKLIVRLARGNDHIPPVVIEAYTIASIFLFGTFMGVGMPVRAMPWIAVGGVVIAIEGVTTNLYYLLFRPSVEANPPHSVYRSFLMSLVGLMQYWLAVSASLFATNQLNQAFRFNEGAPVTVTNVLYFVTTTIFTVGYGDLTPDKNSESSVWMTMLTMVGGFALVTIAIARAISLVSPLPTVEKKSEKNDG